jgi:hypothetical protein
LKRAEANALLQRQWADGDGTGGYDTREGTITWWYRPAGAGGHFGEVARDQPITDFLAHGSAVGTTPREIEQDLREALLACGWGRTKQSP